MSDSYDFLYMHLKTNSLKDKDFILRASMDIEHSFTGRMDMISLHTFFIESSKQIRNAVKLYEEGLFDAAFYCVRSALELARVVAYFSNDENPRDSDMHTIWRQGGRFPFDSKIREELIQRGVIYQQIRIALSSFFDEQDERLKKSQKYIHKQGYKTFYERGFTTDEKEKKRLDSLHDEFYSFIKNSTAEIILLRLSIDPFPILLRDPDVMYKIHFQSMTEPFSDDTVNKILGEGIVKAFCSTEFYQLHVTQYEENEVLNEATYNIINHEIYDRKDWNLIKTQMHLLRDDDKIAIQLFNLSEDIARIYVHGGFTFFFSDTKSASTKMGFDSRDLLKAEKSEGKINNPYYGAYLSFIPVGDEKYWLEHNKPISKALARKMQKIQA
jgi:hypothetical protein